MSQRRLKHRLDPICLHKTIKSIQYYMLGLASNWRQACPSSLPDMRQAGGSQVWARENWNDGK